MKDTKKTKDVAGTRPAEQPAATAAPDAKRRPIKMIRVGDCSASIWSREYAVQGSPRVFYSVTLERSYKDRDGAWKYTRSFDAESLGSVMALCQQAGEYINGLNGLVPATAED